MNDEELALNEVANFAEYVKSRKAELGLSNEEFGKTTKVSGGEISKITSKNKKSVSIHSFYNIAVRSGDSIENARDAVYKHRNLVLVEDYKLDKRTNFGFLMHKLFEGENTFEIIQAKTGINKQRLTDLYFNTSAPEPYEMLLIEKAVGKNPGELMKEYVEKYPVVKKKKDE
ncbi:hypothetical protein SF1_39500 [Sphingobacterium faecium NBRC 15299]|uniref:hypothetical protein n=1 Tax=Sphingobacterium faecium TaxID=34087 RepID=UPI000D337388|nr:hypothetical protein [Sphingobacterium faecium]PTX10171.1 hypothetical protein C8N37_105179 [Sphingobacterium faecium]GEM65968.1 hypothetical protein SF1_39500 [Sphingobacterium faecium NBRC 15299]